MRDFSHIQELDSWAGDLRSSALLVFGSLDESGFHWLLCDRDFIRRPGSRDEQFAFDPVRERFFEDCLASGASPATVSVFRQRPLGAIDNG